MKSLNFEGLIWVFSGFMWLIPFSQAKPEIAYMCFILAYLSQLYNKKETNP